MEKLRVVNGDKSRDLGPKYQSKFSHHGDCSWLLIIKRLTWNLAYCFYLQAYINTIDKIKYVR